MKERHRVKVIAETHEHKFIKAREEDLWIRDILSSPLNFPHFLLLQDKHLEL